MPITTTVSYLSDRSQYPIYANVAKAYDAGLGRPVLAQYYWVLEVDLDSDWVGARHWYFLLKPTPKQVRSLVKRAKRVQERELARRASPHKLKVNPCL